MSAVPTLRTLPGVKNWVEAVEQGAMAQTSPTSAVANAEVLVTKRASYRVVFPSDALDPNDLCEDRDRPTPPQLLPPPPPPPPLSAPHRPSPVHPKPIQPATPTSQPDPTPALTSPIAGQAQHRQSIQLPTWVTQTQDLTASDVSVLAVASQFEGQPPAAQVAGQEEEAGGDGEGEQGGADDVNEVQAGTEGKRLPLLRRDSSSPTRGGVGAGEDGDDDSVASSADSSSLVEVSSPPPPCGPRTRKRPKLNEIITARGFVLLSWRQTVEGEGTGLERVVDRFEGRTAAKRGVGRE